MSISFLLLGVSDYDDSDSDASSPGADSDGRATGGALDDADGALPKARSTNQDGQVEAEGTDRAAPSERQVDGASGEGAAAEVQVPVQVTIALIL